jgi:hypothetical protein
LKAKSYKGSNRWERLYRDVMGKKSHGTAEKVFAKALDELDARDKDILIKRYGLILETEPLNDLQMVEALGITSRDHLIRLIKRAKKRLYEIVRPRTEAERRKERAETAEFGISLLLLEDEDSMTAEEEEFLLKNQRLVSRGISELRTRLKNHVSVARKAKAAHESAEAA